ncbi:universal stress protein [Geodermatophilus sp. URMC 64]
MTADGCRGAVVVGAHRASSDEAVDWAAAEAATRHAPLVLVHAFRPPLALDPYVMVPVADAVSTTPADAAYLLRAAVRRARSVAPDLDLSALLLPGGPSRVLTELSRHAALLVLGGRISTGRHSALSGSASEQVAGRARCPVVVVRSRPGVRSGATRPRVVVGIGPSPGGAPAIGFAFRAAAQRGIPLMAVHAWRPDLPADMEAACEHPEATEGRARAGVDRVLDYWRHRFADVHVERKVLPGDPATSLIAESRGAALVVVGSRGCGSLRTRLFGSVSRTVVRRAHSPVVVVRSEAVWPAGPGAGARRPMTDAA